MRRRSLLLGAAGVVSRPSRSTAQSNDEVERNKAMVRRYYEIALTLGGNPGDLAKVISPDYVSPNADHASGVSAHIARTEAAQRQIGSLFTEYRWVVDEQIGVGAVVATRSHLEAVTTGGRRGTIRGLEWTVFGDDGLMVETEAQLDYEAFLDLL